MKSNINEVIDYFKYEDDIFILNPEPYQTSLQCSDKILVLGNLEANV